MESVSDNKVIAVVVGAIIISIVIAVSIYNTTLISEGFCQRSTFSGQPYSCGGPACEHCK